MPYSIPEYIEIKKAAGDTVAFLSPESDGVEVWIDDEQNGTCTIEIELPLSCEKWIYFTDQHRIYADSKEFVILNPDAVDKQRDGKKLTGKIKAHESWVLLGKKYQTISNDLQIPSPPWGAVIIVSGGAAHGGFDPGSAGSALSYLLNGTGWTVGTVDVTGTFDLETEKESVLYNINQVQEKWGGILVWDSVSHTVSLRDEETWQNYTGYQIRYAKNLKGINRTDDYDLVTRLYPFGENDLNISAVNGGLLYLDNQSYSTDVLEGVWYNQDITDQTHLKTQGEKQLDVMCRPRHNYKTEILDLRFLSGYGHETFARSDMVDLCDEDFGANVRVRIIRYRHNVFQPWLCDVELGDPLEKIAASVAQTVLMAKFYKNVVAPNTSFQNLLKAIINTEATEINGANGDFAVVDGVATWSERVEGTLTGNLVRITPLGLIISSDGGMTWDTAISGGGIHAGAGWIGKIAAGVIQIGAATTFEDGYDPTQITADSVGMGVDADCVGLWHFDGSLNSHKGVMVTADANFDTGCFGQAVKVEEGTTNLISSPRWYGSIGGVSPTTYSNFHWKIDATANADGQYVYYFPVFNVSQNTNYTFSFKVLDAILPSSAFLRISAGDNGAVIISKNLTISDIGKTVSVTADSGSNTQITTGIYVSANTGQRAVFEVDYLQLEAKNHATPFVEDTRLGVLKAPTTGLSVSQNTINFRAKNLSASANGSVLVDLPKSDNTQGMQVGISNTTGHEGEVYIQINNLTPGAILYAESSINEGYSPSKAVDGDSATRWCTTQKSSAVEVWFAIKISAAKIVSQVKLLGHTSYPELNWKGFKIQGSNNSTNGYDGTWTDLATGLNTSATAWWDTFVFANTNEYQWIRLVGLSQPQSGYPERYYITFSEVELYESTSTVYGLNKSTLTAWDSISLAWKSDRLSLVVNDTEAAYIENPSLPSAFGSYLFIGTDRNGANAINTLVDELRIDKVYKDVAIRTAWYKAGSPFYTSEDMKQWPGYIRIVTDGVEVYDSEGNLRVKLGSWLKDLLRKYGLKIINGEIYSSTIQSGVEGATSYIKLTPGGDLEIVKNGETVFETCSYDFMEGSPFYFYKNNGDMYGRILYYADTYPGFAIEGTSAGGGSGPLTLRGSNVHAVGNFYAVEGTKNCLEDTIYGRLAISARESPEVRYIDEGMGMLTSGECRINVDPIFMECIEPHTPDSRWYIQLTPYADTGLYVAEIGLDYFIVKERNTGTSTGAEFSWSLSATRKNYAMIRFMEVLD